MDGSFVQQNSASTEWLKKLEKSLRDQDKNRKVGEDWTVAVALAHLAFWDRRVQFVLDRTQRDGKLSGLEIDVIVNDLLLPTWEAVPGAEAARLAVETAQALDRQLESLPEVLLEQVKAHNSRWVNGALHRNEHLDELDRALKG
jgi:hypothetical protein